MVESEGTPFPCGLGDDPHPVRLRAGPLWLCLSPHSPELTLPSFSTPLCDFFHSHPLRSPLHTRSLSRISCPLL